MALRILIADDDEDLRAILRAILGEFGDVLEAADGVAALRLVYEKRPALVLLDVAMPRLGGLATLKAARRLVPELLVVMLTAEGDLSVANNALREGARVFVTKPFDPRALREEVCRLLGLSAPAPPYRPWKVEC